MCKEITYSKVSLKLNGLVVLVCRWMHFFGWKSSLSSPWVRRRQYCRKQTFIVFGSKGKARKLGKLQSQNIRSRWNLCLQNLLSEDIRRHCLGAPLSLAMLYSYPLQSLTVIKGWLRLVEGGQQITAMLFQFFFALNVSPGVEKWCSASCCSAVSAPGINSCMDGFLAGQYEPLWRPGSCIC